LNNKTTPILDLRAHWRKALLAQRESFVSEPHFGAFQSSLGASLCLVLQHLEPDCLGLYWPIRGEFDPINWIKPQQMEQGFELTLPYAQRAPISMHYRLWDGERPSIVDECGIPAAEGQAVVPDVVLVPCVGFTTAGHRLGYGAGYFDRWLAAHPHVTAVGVAWSFCEIPANEFSAHPHDQPLMILVTETGVIT
jgi:5-formyltetrahydrofolate cyclo-ligase